MTLLLIDGNGLAHRAHHSTKANPQFRSDGLPVSAIGKFLDLVWWLLGNVGKPQLATHGAVIFDAPGKNWRHNVLPTYKAGREHDPAIAPQLRICREIVPTLGLKAIQLRGYEADDLLATYTRLAEEAGLRTVIITVDKDMLQLLRPGVTIFNPMRDEFVAGESERVLFGDTASGVWLRPDQIRHVQALAGDTVDGFTGIPGIGLKGAADLINRFGDVEAVLSQAGAITQTALRAKVQGRADLARQGFALAGLDDRCPVRVDLDEMELLPIDAPRLLSCLKSLEIVQFARRFAYPFGLRADEAEPDPEISALADEQMEWLAA